MALQQQNYSELRPRSTGELNNPLWHFRCWHFSIPEHARSLLLALQVGEQPRNRRLRMFQQWLARAKRPARYELYIREYSMSFSWIYIYYIYISIQSLNSYVRAKLPTTNKAHCIPDFHVLPVLLRSSFVCGNSSSVAKFYPKTWIRSKAPFFSGNLQFVRDCQQIRTLSELLQV